MGRGGPYHITDERDSEGPYLSVPAAPPTTRRGATPYHMTLSIQLSKCVRAVSEIRGRSWSWQKWRLNRDRGR